MSDVAFYELHFRLKALARFCERLNELCRNSMVV
jgi:hypothetical protein